MIIVNYAGPGKPTAPSRPARTRSAVYAPESIDDACGERRRTFARSVSNAAIATTK